MICNWYVGVLYLPGGQGNNEHIQSSFCKKLRYTKCESLDTNVNLFPAFVSVLLNTFVHACMYSYYLLAALGPSFRKYLWWKKYLTQMQLVWIVLINSDFDLIVILQIIQVQFVLVIVHIIVGLVNNCKAPTWLAYFTITYLCTLVVLFINFYIKSYQKLSAIRSQKFKIPMHYNGTKYDLKAAGDWTKNKKLA